MADEIATVGRSRSKDRRSLNTSGNFSVPGGGHVKRKSDSISLRKMEKANFDSSEQQNLIEAAITRTKSRIGEEEAISRLVEEEIQLRRYGSIQMGKNVMEQQEIMAHWEMDKATIAFIEDSLKRNADITDKMLRILDDFDARLSKTLDSIESVHQQITKQQKVYANLNDCIKNINEVLSEFDSVISLGDVVRAGIDDELNEYLVAIDRIQAAKAFMERNNGIKGAAEKQEKLADLENDAKKILFAHYTKLLGPYEKALPSHILEDLKNPAKAASTDEISDILLPAKVTMDVHNIIERLEKLDSIKSYQEFYVRVRSTVLKQSIQAAFDIATDEGKALTHCNVDGDEDDEFSVVEGGRSGREGQSFRESVSTAEKRRTLDLVVDKAAKRLSLNPNDNALLQRLSHAAGRKKNSAPLSNLIAPPVGGKGYRRGSHPFLKFIDVLLVLLKSEAALAEKIVPRNRVHQIFDMVAEPTMKIFKKICGALLKVQAKHSDQIYGVTVMLDLWGHLQPLLRKFDAVLSPDLITTPRSVLLPSFERDPENTVREFFSDLEGAIRHAFVEFEDTVKNDPVRSLPDDGTVHQIASNAIAFLVALIEYKPIVTGLLPGVDVDERFATYVKTILDNLKSNLVQKAKRDDSLSNIFRLNNFYFIWKKLTTTELFNEVDSSVVDQYWDAFVEERKIYTQSWSAACEYLKDDWKPEKSKIQRLSQKVSTKSKPNQAIKDRFTGFNYEMKLLFETQQHFTIADDDLRTQMRKLIRDLVVPGYKHIVEKYQDVNFSKKIDQYIKYSWQTLEEMIMNEFFEGRLKQKTNLEKAIRLLRLTNY